MKQFNEKHFFLGAIAIIVAFLFYLSASSPELPLGEVTGQAVHKLALFLGVVVVTLFGLGGHKFQLVERLKESPLSLAVLAGSIIVGAAIALGH